MENAETELSDVIERLELREGKAEGAKMGFGMQNIWVSRNQENVAAGWVEAQVVETSQRQAETKWWKKSNEDLLPRGMWVSSSLGLHWIHPLPMLHSSLYSEHLSLGCDWMSLCSVIFNKGLSLLSVSWQIKFKVTPRSFKTYFFLLLVLYCYQKDWGLFFSHQKKAKKL